MRIFHTWWTRKEERCVEWKRRWSHSWYWVRRVTKYRQIPCRVAVPNLCKFCTFLVWPALACLRPYLLACTFSSIPDRFSPYLHSCHSTQEQQVTYKEHMVPIWQSFFRSSAFLYLHVIGKESRGLEISNTLLVDAKYHQKQVAVTNVSPCAAVIVSTVFRISSGIRSLRCASGGMDREKPVSGCHHWSVQSRQHQSMPLYGNIIMKISRPFQLINWSEVTFGFLPAS